MNNGAKLIEQITRYHKASDELVEAQKQFDSAVARFKQQDQDTAKAIRAVKGVGGQVLYRGNLYTCVGHDDGQPPSTQVGKAEFEVLG